MNNSASSSQARSDAARRPCTISSVVTGPPSRSCAFFPIHPFDEPVVHIRNVSVVPFLAVDLASPPSKPCVPQCVLRSPLALLGSLSVCDRVALPTKNLKVFRKFFSETLIRFVVQFEPAIAPALLALAAGKVDSLDTYISPSF
jgi:hypothetical protein